jgi:hypothetical protein
LQTGTIAALLYNANKKRSAKALGPDDFVYRPLKQKRKQTSQEMMAALMQILPVKKK